MLDFGEELTVETYKIPWLIWIQILVLILLILLIYFFSAVASDLSDSDANTGRTTSSTASPSSGSIPPQPNKTINRLRLHASQVGEIQSIKGEIAAASTSRRRVLTSAGEEGNNVGEIAEGSSPSSSSSSSSKDGISLHPCNYFRLARLAFLKCFGLDSASDNYSSYNPERKKDR